MHQNTALYVRKHMSGVVYAGTNADAGVQQVEVGDIEAQPLGVIKLLEEETNNPLH